MRTFVFLALPVSILAGCSSKQETPASVGGLGVVATTGEVVPGPQTPAAVSGSRLRAQHVVTADGTRSFVGWYDKERKEPCTFSVAADNTMRCMPPALPQTYSGLFADAACQNPLQAGSATSCGASAVISQTASVPSSKPGCYAVSQTLFAATKIAPGSTVYRPGAQGCQATTVDATTSYYLLGAAIPATAFVEATEVTDAGTGLVARHLESPDGSRQHMGWHLSELDADCAFEIMADGLPHCVPDSASGSEFYSDSTCLVSEGAAINVYDGPCGTQRPRVWLRRGEKGGVCDRTISAFALGKARTLGSAAYRRQGDSCSSVGNPAYTSILGYTLDTEVTLPVALRVGTGTTRLVPALVFASGDRRLVPGWHDTQRDEDCSFAVAADGKVRCLPVAAHATVLFTQSGCKGERVAGLDEASCGTDKPTTGLELSGTCPVTTKVYGLGAMHDLASASQTSTGGHCVGISGAKNVYAATEIAASSFVEGVLTND